MIKVYLALGSNLENPLYQLENALSEINELPAVNLIKVSSLYQNPPVGMKNQPDFLNAVVEINTSLLPEELLHVMQKIESQHGRIRKEQNGPRTLDIDILLYGEKIFCSESLCIPHPRLQERWFVLRPLFEIAPDLSLPSDIPIRSLLLQLEVPPYTVIPLRQLGVCGD